MQTKGVLGGGLGSLKTHEDGPRKGANDLAKMAPNAPNSKNRLFEKSRVSSPQKRGALKVVLDPRTAFASRRATQEKRSVEREGRKPNEHRQELEVSLGILKCIEKRGIKLLSNSSLINEAPSRPDQK